MNKIIAIVGMTGSGKTEAGDFFKKNGYEVLRFGSVVDDAVREAGLPWTPENTALYRKKIRDEFGMAAMAIKMLPKIKQAYQEGKKIALDGLYSWEEYEFLKKQLSDLVLLCIYASPRIRYERLSIRNDRPFFPKEARERDENEVVVTNKGGPIAIADYLVKNESTREEFSNQLKKFLELLQNDSL